jgi:hypothetical protein
MVVVMMMLLSFIVLSLSPQQNDNVTLMLHVRRFSVGH